MTITTVVLTSGTTWTVPSDWSPSNLVQCIGAGGNGFAGASLTGGGGGGGGAFAVAFNVALTAGSSVQIQIGAGGGTSTTTGATWFNGTVVGSASAGANGGTTATSTTGGAGGSASGGSGTQTAGGSGGAGASANGAGGGGGAAGPAGSGAAGGAGTSTLGGTGGTGDNTKGGAGGAGATTLAPAVSGSAGTEMNSGVGAGGGGGGGSLTIGDTSGAAGGNYGAGGGGAYNAGTAGLGKPGVIVITYGFDSFDTDSVATAGITFTNGNLTAQPGAGFSGTACAIAQTIEGKNSGKWYVEFTLVAVSGVAGGEGVGLLASWGLQGNVVNGGFIGGAFSSTSSPDAGWAYYISNNLDHNNTAQTKVNGATYTAGDVIGLAIDLTNNRAWWRKNTGGWIGTTGTPDPATNTSGFDISGLVANGSHVYPAVNMSGSSAKFTANFGASAFTGSVPSGFTSGWTNTTAGTYFGTFAATGKGSSSVNSPPQNDKAVSKYTANLTGSVTSIVIPFAGTTVFDLKGLIYDATGTGGLPGALLGISTNIIGGGTAPYGEKTFTFSGVSVVSGTSYWFGFVSDQASTTSTNVTLCPPQTSGIAFNSGTYASPTNPFGASPSTANFRYPVIINVGVAVNVSITGVSATAAVGSFSLTSSPNISLSGVNATAAAGSFSLRIDTGINLTGVSASGQIGSFASNISPSLIGAVATGQVGAFTVQGSASVPLVGVNATGQIGSFGIHADINLSLIGVLATGETNTVEFDISGNISLVSVFATSAFGILHPVTVSPTPSVDAYSIMRNTPVPAMGAMDDDNVASMGVMSNQVPVYSIMRNSAVPSIGTMGNTAIACHGDFFH